MELICKYFPELTNQQLQQFERLQPLYQEWNQRINVISRKDMGHFYEHHVLHSLGIAKAIRFLPGSQVIDVGTGGGFPGIPLAILFPETDFLLVDSIGKKIKVVNEVVKAIGIQNVSAIQTRAEDVKGKFDFVVSRAVTTLPEFMKLVAGKYKIQNRHNLPNGVLYLKGGELAAELASIRNPYQIFSLCDFFQEAFFETKKLVSLKA